MPRFGKEIFVPGEQINHWCPTCNGQIVPKDEWMRRGMWKHRDFTAKCSQGQDVDCPATFIEYLVIWGDHTWSTTVEEVPPELLYESCANIRVDWANIVLGSQNEYRNALMFTVWSLKP
jgi:hypothetical protein